MEPRVSTRCGNVAFAPRKAVSRLTDTVARQSASVSSSGPPRRTRPTLFCTTSIRPNASSAVATAADHLRLVEQVGDHRQSSAAGRHDRVHAALSGALVAVDHHDTRPVSGERGRASEADADHAIRSITAMAAAEDDRRPTVQSRFVRHARDATGRPRFRTQRPRRRACWIDGQGAHPTLMILDN